MADPESNLCLAFLAVAAFDGGASLRGGLLVTDGRTRPVEFRVTDPVRPTQLQRTLYGTTFDAHVHADVVGAPLLRAAEHAPNVVLVRDPQLLAVRDASPVPVVCVGPEHELLVAMRRDTPSFLLAAPDPRATSLVLLGRPEDGERLEPLVAALQRVFAHHALLEPFDRLQAALQQLHGAAAV